jgi:hypothetical protein
MRTVCLVVAVLLLFGLSSPVDAFEKKTLVSPDKKYTAIISPSKKAVFGSGESLIEIFLHSGTKIFSKDYFSEDGEHGFGVEKAGWTPNSKYFVYSMSSSGGHQAWHFPTFFYSIDKKKLVGIDKVGPVTSPDFTLEYPDKATFLLHKNENLEIEKKVNIRLSAFE